MTGRKDLRMPAKKDIMQKTRNLLQRDFKKKRRIENLSRTGCCESDGEFEYQ